MAKANTVSARPASRVLVTQGPDTCVFTIPKLAQYLGLTNWRTEELLREGKIKFKWVGTPGLKRVKFAGFKSVGDEIVVCLANLR